MRPASDIFKPHGVEKKDEKTLIVIGSILSHNTLTLNI